LHIAPAGIYSGGLFAVRDGQDRGQIAFEVDPELAVLRGKPDFRDEVPDSLDGLGIGVFPCDQLFQLCDLLPV
jgi:hypothetical protein